jgi:hypothetical protein
MHTFLFALLTSAVAFAAGNQVAARDYPFCIQGEEFGRGRGDCSFTSYQQCQATASGRLAYCRINPAFRNSDASIKSAQSHRNGHQRTAPIGGVIGCHCSAWPASRGTWPQPLAKATVGRSGMVGWMSISSICGGINRFGWMSTVTPHRSQSSRASTQGSSSCLQSRS